MTANDISIALLIEHEDRVARAARAAAPAAPWSIRRLTAWLSVRTRRPADARG